MNHVCSRITEPPNDETIRRIFNDSEEKIKEGTLPQFWLSNTSSEKLFISIKSEIYTHSISGQAIGYYQDDYLCWIGWGSIRPFQKVKATVYTQKGFIAGKNQSNSRAYLYSTDFWNALKAYHDSNYKTLYTAVGSYLLKDSTACLFEEQVGNPNLYNKDTYLCRYPNTVIVKSPFENLNVSIEGLHLGQTELFEHRVADMRLD
jgi:hypothetical protein